MDVHDTDIKDSFKKKAFNDCSRRSGESDGTRFAKIAGYIIDMVRYYSFDSHTRDLASRAPLAPAAQDPRKAQPARRTFSLFSSPREPFFSWRRLLAISPRIAETSWRAPPRRAAATTLFPPSLLLEPGFHVTSRFSFAKYAHVAIRHRSSCESRDNVLFFLYVTKIIGKRTSEKSWSLESCYGPQNRFMNEGREIMHAWPSYTSTIRWSPFT